MIFGLIGKVFFKNNFSVWPKIKILFSVFFIAGCAAYFHSLLNRRNTPPANPTLSPTSSKNPDKIRVILGIVKEENKSKYFSENELCRISLLRNGDLLVLQQKQSKESEIVSTNKEGLLICVDGQESQAIEVFPKLLGDQKSFEFSFKGKESITLSTNFELVLLNGNQGNFSLTLEEKSLRKFPYRLFKIDKKTVPQDLAQKSSYTIFLPHRATPVIYR